MENKLRHIIREIISEELNEMAAIPKLLKIGDATKLEQAKRLYDDETFWVRKMIDAVEAAGETGVPRMLYKEKGNEGRSIDGLTNIIDKGQQLVNPKVADFIDIGLFVEFGSVIPKKVKSTEVGKRGRPAKSTDGMVAVRNAMNSREELEDMDDDDEDENPLLNESFIRMQKPLNKQLKLMKKQPLNEQFKRMQKLAGLNENSFNPNTSRVEKIKEKIQQEYPEIIKKGTIEKGTEEWLFLLELSLKTFGIYVKDSYDILDILKVDLDKMDNGKFDDLAQDIDDLGNSYVTDLEKALEELGVEVY